MNAKAFAVGALVFMGALGLVASVSMGVTLPSHANPRAVDATESTTGADVTGHPDADVNGVPPGPPAWLGDGAPYGPPEWAMPGEAPTWVTLP